ESTRGSSLFMRSLLCGPAVLGAGPGSLLYPVPEWVVPELTPEVPELVPVWVQVREPVPWWLPTLWAPRPSRSESTRGSSLLAALEEWGPALEEPCAPGPSPTSSMLLTPPV